MGGIKQEQTDAPQQPKGSHSADQPQDEVSYEKQGVLLLTDTVFLIIITIL